MRESHAKCVRLGRSGQLVSGSVMYYAEKMKVGRQPWEQRSFYNEGNNGQHGNIMSITWRSVVCIPVSTTSK